MHATIRRGQVPRFHLMIKKRFVYLIRNLKIVPINGEVRAVTNKLRILFLLITSIKEANKLLIEFQDTPSSLWMMMQLV